MASTLLPFIGGILVFCFPYSLPVILCSNVLRGLGNAALAAVIFTFCADLVDYSEWNTGIRAEGFAYSATTFGMEFGTGIGAAILSWALAFGKYDATLTLQKPETVQALLYFA